MIWSILNWLEWHRVCKYLFILQSCGSSGSNYKPILSLICWLDDGIKRHTQTQIICEDTYVVVLLQKYRVYLLNSYYTIFGITHTSSSHISWRECCRIVCYLNVLVNINIKYIEFILIFRSITYFRTLFLSLPLACGVIRAWTNSFWGFCYPSCHQVMFCIRI